MEQRRRTPVPRQPQQRGEGVKVRIVAHENGGKVILGGVLQDAHLIHAFLE